MSESKSKSTPGPWSIRGQGKTFSGRPNGCYRIDGPSGMPVATAEGAANAALIASAPALLAALEAVSEIMPWYHKGEAPGHMDACGNPDNCGHCLAMRKARAALAAARGEEAR